MSKQSTDYTETFRDDRGQLWGFAPGAVMATPILEPPPAPPPPITWRSLIKLTAEVALKEIKAFRPGMPELCGLVIVGGAIAAGAGAGMIIDGLFKIIFLPRCLFRTLELSKQHTEWEFKPFPVSMRAIAILAMLWQWATIFSPGSSIGVLLAPLLGLLYSSVCTFLLFKIAYSYSR